MAEFKTDHLCVIHPGLDTESFALENPAAFMFFDNDDTTKLAIETVTDWIDFEDSEMLGGSETFLRIWGLPVTSDDVLNGTKTLEPSVTSLPPENDDVHAWFFGTIGHRVDKLTVEFPGGNRLRAVLHVEDITEETEDAVTRITIDTKLAGKPSELEAPA
jgi:hypothetical protein